MKARVPFWIPGLAWIGVLAAAAQTETVTPPGADRTAPLPYGIGLTFYHQAQDYNLSNLDVTLPGDDPLRREDADTYRERQRSRLDAFEAFGIPSSALQGLKAENRVNEINLKADTWVLPFLNVFGLLGYVDGQTIIRMPPEIADRVGFNRIKVEYDGPLYGAGATLAAGAGPWFGSVSAVYTYIRPSAADTTVKTFVLMPRVGVGLHTGKCPPVDVWVGAMYQDVSERNKGSFELPGIGRVNYDAKLSQEEDWNTLVGARITLDERWEIELEGGFGKRQSAALNVICRF